MFEGGPGVTLNQSEASRLLANAHFASQHHMVSTSAFIITSFKKNAALAMDEPKASIVSLCHF
jgi:hypothetical protein